MSAKNCFTTHAFVPREIRKKKVTDVLKLRSSQQAKALTALEFLYKHFNR